MLHGRHRRPMLAVSVRSGVQKTEEGEIVEKDFVKRCSQQSLAVENPNGRYMGRKPTSVKNYFFFILNLVLISNKHIAYIKTPP